MDAAVAQVGEWWAVVAGTEPVRTPMGTPLVSRHRALADEVAADVARWGADPTAKTTTFSLQASYLDFGLRVRREVLEENTAAIWPDDLYVRRPADPALAQALARLWPPSALDRPAFRDALRGASLRQVIAAMTAGHVLRSALLGHLATAAGAGLVPLARGACGRHYEALRGRLAPGDATPSRRHLPTDVDAAFCEVACCAPGATGGGPFEERCALVPLLDKLRRWSAWPEETVKG